MPGAYPPAMKRLLALLPALVAPVLSKAAAGSRPNILLILADDLGFSDLSCYGYPSMQDQHPEPAPPMTPNQPNHHSVSHQAPVDGQELPGNRKIFESTKRMIGGLAPQLSFGVAQRDAVLRASMAGATLDYGRSVCAANRHINSRDPGFDAVAVVHAGMAFVAALRAGASPSDAGVCVAEALSKLLGIEGTLGATDVGY